MSDKKINICINDSMKMGDGIKLYDKIQTTDFNKNYVEIYEIDENGNKTKLVDGNNLITYRGRSMSLCRLFGKNLTYQAGGSTATQLPFYGMKDKYISWLSIGNGGASSSNNQNPLSVDSTDYGMGGDGSTHGSVSGGTRYVTVNGRTYHKFDDGYPEYLPETEIVNNYDILGAMQNVSYNSVKRDAYLVTKIQVTFEAGEANGTNGTQQISEAGLFMAESDSYTDTSWVTPYTTYNQHLEMFARVTFPTITKFSGRAYVLTWYVFL